MGQLLFLFGFGILDYGWVWLKAQKPYLFRQNKPKNLPKEGLLTGHQAEF